MFVVEGLSDVGIPYMIGAIRLSSTELVDSSSRLSGVVDSSSPSSCSLSSAIAWSA